MKSCVYLILYAAAFAAHAACENGEFEVALPASQARRLIAGLITRHQLSRFAVGGDLVLDSHCAPSVTPLASDGTFEVHLTERVWRVDMLDAAVRLRLTRACVSRVDTFGDVPDGAVTRLRGEGGFDVQFDPPSVQVPAPLRRAHYQPPVLRCEEE